MPRGRKPKPTAEKLAEGNPGKRPLNASEPKLEPALPDAPEHLTDVAKEEWQRLAKELFDAGILTNADRGALAAYCEAWADWVDARKHIDSDGKTILSPKGFEMQSPWVTISNRAINTMMKIAAEFGLTPSSRSRIHVEPKKTPEEEAEEKIFGKG
jgi:P27 family predicted phage terminase small subunit